MDNNKPTKMPEESQDSTPASNVQQGEAQVSSSETAIQPQTGQQVNNDANNIQRSTMPPQPGQMSQASQSVNSQPQQSVAQGVQSVSNANQQQAAPNVSAQPQAPVASQQPQVGQQNAGEPTAQNVSPQQTAPTQNGNVQQGSSDVSQAAVAESVPDPSKLVADRPDNVNILVVEDEVDARTMFVDLISSEGYEVSSAVDGVDALAKAAADKFHLILLDIVMPNKDGIEVLQEIKNNPDKYGDPVVVMLTNISGDAAIEKAMEIGAAGFRLKVDTEPGELLRDVEEFLGGKVQDVDSEPVARPLT